MRLVYTVDDQVKAHKLSHLLQQYQIENQLEIITDKDWGSHAYGQTTCRLWVYEEDRFDEATALIDDFNANPNDPRYVHLSAAPADNDRFLNIDPTISQEPLPAARPKEAMGRFTRTILLLCTFLFIAGALAEPKVTSTPPANLPLAPIYQPEVNKALMYDYPITFTLVDKLIKLYGLDSVDTPESQSKEQRQLIAKIAQTPYWEGFYPQLINFFKGATTHQHFNAPMFEKIQQGEVWRLFSPSLLHSDIFHLFFNMIWLIILGRQLEIRLGKWKYLLFILITALFTNTAQYLMSGANFLGFSGVLCSMLTFIWIRQRNAAWEGYQLEKGTIAFILFFILFMFILQLVSFVLEAKADTVLPIGIANTAHLTGALIGWLLGRLNFFSWQQHP